MSKLRAEIKWSHRQKSNSAKLPLPNDLSNKIEPENEARHKTESEEIQNEDNTTTEDFDEEGTVKSDSLGEFSQFLNVWVVISAEETEELTSIEYEEDEEIFSLSVGDIIHPVIDSNAKWDILTLFNELPLP
ncbi:hypothetical protein C2G38_2183367 [Gigaspora rosea]|uniref:Uncharacterized protein n=1 Tax=Gigaspora rosea TaxID=44941 RepID=A0A397VG77_9GLOM|nr:hypothetical protein C2G38_2183367 [Gigaspora rosea]